MRINYLVAAGLLMLIVAGCKSKKDKDFPRPADGFDRKAMLANFADNIIKPGYVSFKSSFDLMKAKSGSFLSAPDAVLLQQFRAVWKNAYIELQKVEMFEIGPADAVMLRSNFNIYPFNIKQAEANINSGTYNLDEAGQIAAKGFPALDYFLNGSGADDASIVAWFSDPVKGASRRKYVSDIIAHMDQKLNFVVSRWHGAYRDEFVNNTGTDASSSTAKLVNAYILGYERFVRSGKIGIPSGIMGSSLTTPSPEKVEAYYKKDLSRELALTAQQAILDFYRGKSFTSASTGPSFKTYFSALGTKGTNGRLMADILDEQMEKAIIKLNAVQPDLSQQIQDDRNKMISVFEEMQPAVRYLKLDMTSAMGISISYTDNDGD